MVMLVELQATCSALGYQEGSQYVKEPDCLGMYIIYALIHYYVMNIHQCSNTRITYVIFQYAYIL